MTPAKSTRTIPVDGPDVKLAAQAFDASPSTATVQTAPNSGDLVRAVVVSRRAPSLGLPARGPIRDFGQTVDAQVLETAIRGDVSGTIAVPGHIGRTPVHVGADWFPAPEVSKPTRVSQLRPQRRGPDNVWVRLWAEAAADEGDE